MATSHASYKTRSCGKQILDYHSQAQKTLDEAKLRLAIEVSLSPKLHSLQNRSA